MSHKPLFWLVYNDKSLATKRSRYAEEADKVGFAVREIFESDILAFEVKGSQLITHLASETGFAPITELPAAVLSITDDHLLAPVAAELVILLEQLGTQVINSTEARELASNKWWTHMTLAQRGLATPRTFYLPKQTSSLQHVAELLGYPLVLKGVYGSKGKAVWLCHDYQTLQHHVEQLTPEREIIVQEYLANSHGRDLRVIVVEGEVIATMLRTAAPGKFHANLGAEGEGKPFKLTAAQTELAVKASTALGLGLAGVDLLFKNDNELVVGEVNSNPGLGIEQVTGVNVATRVMQTLWRLCQSAG